MSCWSSGKDLPWGARCTRFSASQRLKNEEFLECQKKCYNCHSRLHNLKYCKTQSSVRRQWQSWLRGRYDELDEYALAAAQQ